MVLGSKNQEFHLYLWYVLFTPEKKKIIKQLMDENLKISDKCIID